MNVPWLKQPLKVFSNVIPRRRDRHGNPIPRRIVYVDPVVSQAPDALRLVALAHLDSPEKAEKLYPYLLAETAIASAENAQAMHQLFDERLAEHNRLVQAQIEQAEQKVEKIKEAEREAFDAASLACSKLGLVLAPDQAELRLPQEDPGYLQALAGKHDLAQLPACHDALYRWIAALGGGGAFGISLGLLTGQLELFDLAAAASQLCLWWLIGSALMSLVGAAVFGAAEFLGVMAARSQGQTGASRGVGATLIVLTSIFVSAVVLVESHVERLGLFRALNEQSSLQGHTLSPGQLAWVSYALILPVIGAYLLLGYRRGWRTATEQKLLSLQLHELGVLRASSEYQDACRCFAVWRTRVADTADQLSRLNELKTQIRDSWLPDELLRAEDTEMDAAAASWIAAQATQVPTQKQARKVPWLLLRLVGRGGEGAIARTR